MNHPPIPHPPLQTSNPSRTCPSSTTLTTTSLRTSVHATSWPAMSMGPYPSKTPFSTLSSPSILFRPRPPAPHPPIMMLKRNLLHLVHQRSTHHHYRYCPSLTF